MEKFVNNYENKMPCDRGDLDADFPWRLPGHGKRGSGWKKCWNIPLWMRKKFRRK